MNNEDFDEAIRKKLESLNQTYTESDIDKVYNHVQRRRKFLWKGSAGSWLLYSLSAAAFTIVTVWSVSHFKNNDQVSFKNNNSVGKANVATVDSVKLIEVPADTVSYNLNESKADAAPGARQPDSSVSYKGLKIKRLSQDVVSDNSQTEKHNKSVALIKAADRKSSSPSDQGKNKSSACPVVTSENKSVKDIFIPDKKQGSASPLAIIGNKALKEVAVPDKNQSSAIRLENAANKTLNEVVIPVNNKLSLSNNTEENTGITDTLTPALRKEKEGFNSGKIISQLTKTKDTIVPENLAVSATKPDSTLKYIKFRVGPDFQLSNQSIGMGISGELFFNKYLSFETGLKYQIYNSEHFADKNDLFSHKRHNFNGRIENHFSDNDHISGISIDNRLLEIPLSLKYYVPLKMNFGISFALGTDLDIYLNQKLGFSNRVDSNHMENHNFQARGEVVPFNNFVISAGLEKQWKSWSFQLQPFIKPKLKEVFYKPKEMEFGIGVGVKYSFGK